MLTKCRKNMRLIKILETTVKAKNCPSCGSIKEIYVIREDSVDWESITYKYAVACGGSGCGYVHPMLHETINKAVETWNETTVDFQDIERTWLTVDQVYETRWDCMVVPEGVRQAA